MHKQLLIAVALVTGTTVAQNNLTDFLNMGVTFTSRNAANNVPATIFTRWDSSAYAGWGVDPAFPGTRTFSGLHFLIQDQDLSTVDTFQLTVYTESTTPDLPNVTTPLATTGNFSLPVGTGIGAYNISANFTTPINAPPVDVFVGVSTTLGWNATTTDGLSIWATSSLVTSAVRDEPGFAAPTTVPQNTYSGAYIPSTSTQTNAIQRQSWIEPIIATPAGVASALHYADPVHSNANTSPGTVCMFSGQFPDSRNPPRTVGRADDVGMTFRHAGVAAGTPVFFLIDIAPGFSPEVALSTFIPGSTGVACVNPASMMTVALGFTVGTSASNVIVIPAGARASIAGLPLIHQAVAFDPVLNVALSGPCAKQVL
jgi:hypothetical protein